MDCTVLSRAFDQESKYTTYNGDDILVLMLYQLLIF